MNVTRVAVTLGIAWLAANLLLQRSRAVPSDGDDALAPFPSVDPGLPLGLAAGPSGAGATASSGDPAATADAGVAGAVADSPNDAERLQARGVAAPSDDESAGGDPLKSTSQDSPYARAPGLPDFARGA